MKGTKTVWNMVLIVALSLAILVPLVAFGNPSQAALEKVQVPFIENQGQIAHEAVRFYARTFGGTLFAEDGGVITYSLPAENGKGCVIRECISNREVEPVGIDPSPTKVSYFTGNDPKNWRTGLPTYNEVSFGEVYEGIGLTLRAYGSNVEKIFTVEPGTSPEAIKVQVEGAEGLGVKQDGELELQTSVGVVRFTRPVAYQESKDGSIEEVEVAYAVCDQEIYGFTVGAYDPTRALVIDPLLASTFIGHSENDLAVFALDLDSNDNVFVAGRTVSSSYPTTVGAYDQTYNGGGSDVFVSKLNSDLSSLLASTFIGGNLGDGAEALAIDAGDNIYVAGWTYNGATDYPTTIGGYDLTHNGDFDVFVSKLSNDLGTLSKSTLIGGNTSEYAYALALTGGNVYVTGKTNSNELVTPYPTTDGAYDTELNDGDDVFVSKLNSDLSALSASTFIGGNFDDEAHALDFDSNGNVFVAGYTDYHSSDPYPTTGGAYDVSHNGGLNDVFVSKLTSDLTTLSASTFLGGNSSDQAYALAIDGNDNVYVAGHTHSGSGGAPVPFPTTAGAYDQTYSSQEDVFVSKLNNNLTVLSASTYLGNVAIDYGYDLALNSDGNVVVTGSAGSNFPTTAGAYDESHNGNLDVFVTELKGDLTGPLVVSTFIGGSADDVASALVLDSDGNIYVAGRTGSSGYPTTNGAYDESHNGGADVLVSKLTSDLALPVELSSFTATPGDGQVALRWVTESEIANLGFHIYRATDEDGFYDRITSDLIEGAGTASNRNTYTFSDPNVTNGITYWYKLEDVAFDGATAQHGPIAVTPQAKAQEIETQTPDRYDLSVNVPNPFNPQTTIAYQLPEASEVSLIIRNAAGQTIRTLVRERREAGLYQVVWDSVNDAGKQVAAGVYLYELKAGDFVKVRKMTLLR